MDKDERNRVMDGLLKALNGIDFRDLTYLTSPTDVEAIRECDKIARAWDALYCEAIKPTTNGRCQWQYLKDKMDALLSPPPPKDPLGILEEIVEIGESGFDPEDPPRYDKVDIGAIKYALAEIRRLRGMK